MGSAPDRTDQKLQRWDSAIRVLISPKADSDAHSHLKTAITNIPQLGRSCTLKSLIVNI